MKTEETGIERAVRFAKEPADAVKEFEAELKRFKQLFSVTPSGAIGWNLVCGDETSPATHAWFVANEMKLFWRAIRLAGPESVLFEVVDLEALDLLSDWVYETSKRPPELSPSRPDDSPNTVFTSPEDAQRISEGNSRAVGLFRRLQRSLREFSDAVSFKELLNDPRNDSPQVEDDSGKTEVASPIKRPDADVGKLPSQHSMFYFGELALKIGCDAKTLNRYADLASVPTPEHGEKNMKYDETQWRAICQSFIDHSRHNGHRKNAACLMKGT